MDATAILEIAKVAGTILGTAAFGIWTYSKLREKALSRKYGLKPNPTRCGEMIARVEGLEKRSEKLEENNREDHGRIFQRIEDLAVEVAKIAK
jgi:hypothetical protein